MDNDFHDPTSEPAGKPDRGFASAWEFRLYTAGQGRRSVAALENLTRICEEHLKRRYQIEVIDLLKHPERAGEDQIVAIPTLVRRIPPPMRRLVGDLSDWDRTLAGLEIRVGPTHASGAKS